MKKCLLKDCNKDISHKGKNVRFCNSICIGIYKSSMILTPEKINAIRWAKIGASSSYEAMLFIYKLFKAQSHQHREV